MNLRIVRYPLVFGDRELNQGVAEVSVDMRVGATNLTFGWDKNNLYVWALEDSRTLLTTRMFRVIFCQSTTAQEFQVGNPDMPDTLSTDREVGEFLGFADRFALSPWKDYFLYGRAYIFEVQ